MRTLYLFTLLCFCFLTRLSAQTSEQPAPLNPSLDRVFPPPPNAAALGKFGSVPVGLSTGIPSVGVPLYTYENKATGLSLSVTLDYHAGGVRVDEVASSVGIGWALSAGGVVSRTMRGIYDEMEGVGFINSGPLPQSEEAGNAPYDVSARPFNDMNAWMLDSQNDIFSFNFNGRSGKFLYGKNGDFLMVNQQKLKVENETEEINGRPMIGKFTITDELGYRYIFDAEEVTTNRSMAPNPSVYTTSWYLTKILTPSGKDSIVLSYDNLSYTYLVGRSESETVPYPGVSSTSLLPERGYSAAASEHSVQGKRLRAIAFPDGVSITFDYDQAERIDLPGDHLLKKITISNANNRRGYRLTQDYSLNRATLKGVAPFAGAAEVEEPGYEFTYGTPLPDRLSDQQDHWGFYNSNTGSLIPHEIIPVSGGGSLGNYHELGTGSRDTDPNRCKAGALTRIKYPTGGYTDFEMEANQALDPRLGQEITYSKEKYSREGNTTVYCTSSIPTDTTFVFEGDPGSKTSFTVRIPSVSSTPCDAGAPSCKVVLEVKSPDGTLLNRLEYDPPIGSYSPEHSFEMYDLVPGTEYTVTSSTVGMSEGYIAYIDFRWVETRVDNPVVETGTAGHRQLYVGGLRVRRISDYSDGASTPSLVREYEYTMADGSSSGTLGIYPVYSTPVYYESRTDSWEYPDAVETYNGQTAPNYISRSSSTVYPLAYSNGSPVAYKRVVEKKLGNGTHLGRTERYFKSFDQVPAVITKPFPFTPPEYKEWGNGLLDSVLYYNQDGALVKKETNDYKFYIDDYWQDSARLESFRSVSIAPVKYLYDPDDPSVDDPDADPVVPCWIYPRYFKAEFFTPQAGRTELIGTTTYNYDSSGGVIAAAKTYNYDPYFLYLKSSTLQSSTGEVLARSLSYPKDMVDEGRDPNGVYQEMVTRNILSPVVEEVEKAGGTFLSLVRKKFFNPGQGVYVPQSVETQTHNGSLEARLRYHLYDDRGKALTVSKDEGVPLNYLWGYNHSLPVAEVKNASYAEVEAALGGAAAVEALAASTEPSQAQLGALNALREQLPNAIVTTYTYDPLVGMTSSTDANNRTTFYEYDSFGRLKAVRDHDMNVLKTYEYHYAGQ
ncbi:YD repeat-containing protein [Pontibacter ummariensis]|uniref:YD repeat-containing protein n=1 Tax=Pontibacter ummariensis TaxID=1610492 RepID=A0A239LHZ6_9BACT|nr:RHS repeat protein [Pontibacter ummariensis]PRY03364.1 YD repeat-containing protein [Pontibacter ummariensis]SNT29985.1 YD repeat-containing protein [Pontibacter ummariensis]